MFISLVRTDHKSTSRWICELRFAYAYRWITNNSYQFSVERHKDLRRLYPDVDEIMVKFVSKGWLQHSKPIKDKKALLKTSPFLGHRFQLNSQRLPARSGIFEYLSRYIMGLSVSAPQPVATNDVRKEFERIYNCLFATPMNLFRVKEKELPLLNLPTSSFASEKVWESTWFRLWTSREIQFMVLIKGTTVDFIVY